MSGPYALLRGLRDPSFMFVEECVAIKSAAGPGHNPDAILAVIQILKRGVNYTRVIDKVCEVLAGRSHAVAKQRLHVAFPVVSYVNIDCSTFSSINAATAYTHC